VIAAFATAAAVIAFISGTLALDRRRDARLAHAVHTLREAFQQVSIYRVATAEERANEPRVTVEGMREFGALTTTIQGKVVVSRYCIDESGTIVATRHGSSLYVLSLAGDVFYETVCFSLGMPCTAPTVNCEWLPTSSSDAKMLAVHRARIATAAAALQIVSTPEHLAELLTDISKRTSSWRQSQDQDQLFEADLRNILQGSYEARVEGVRAQIGRDLPRAKLRRA